MLELHNLEEHARESSGSAYTILLQCPKRKVAKTWH